MMNSTVSTTVSTLAPTNSAVVPPRDAEEEKYFLHNTVLPKVLGTFTEELIHSSGYRHRLCSGVKPSKVAAILTGAYLIYEYWDVLTKPTREHDSRHGRLSRSRSRSLARSRSRSRSRNYYKQIDSKHRRGRKSRGRCPDCSLCDLQQQ